MKKETFEKGQALLAQIKSTEENILFLKTIDNIQFFGKKITEQRGNIVYANEGREHNLKQRIEAGNGERVIVTQKEVSTVELLDKANSSLTKELIMLLDRTIYQYELALEKLKREFDELKD